MRQIGQIENQRSAERLLDYLLTLKIDARAERTNTVGESYAIWVLDEDRLLEARETLREFQADPNHDRYASANRQAEQLRVAAAKEQKERQARIHHVSRSWRFVIGPTRGAWTAIGISVLVALATNLGETKDGVLGWLLIATPTIQEGGFSWPGLSELFSGQIWRVVTPALVHFGVTHLFFNCWWMHSFGGLIERREGTSRFALVFFVTAIAGNLLQYGLEPNPLFGGLSGVVYGMLGYLIVKQTLEPELGYRLPQITVIISLIFFVYCWTGRAGGIANWAHAGGLASGMLLALMSRAALRRLMRKLK